MGVLDKWLGKARDAADAAPVQFTFTASVPDPGLGIAGEAIEADECYVEISISKACG